MVFLVVLALFALTPPIWFPDGSAQVFDSSDRVTDLSDAQTTPAPSSIAMECLRTPTRLCNMDKLCSCAPSHSMQNAVKSVCCVPHWHSHASHTVNTEMAAAVQHNKTNNTCFQHNWHNITINTLQSSALQNCDSCSLECLSDRVLAGVCPVCAVCFVSVGDVSFAYASDLQCSLMDAMSFCRNDSICACLCLFSSLF